MKPRDYLKEWKRMCKLFDKSCKDCLLTLNGLPCITNMEAMEPADFAKMYDAVAEWSDAHPERTRQSEFLKMFPNASTDDNGILWISPCGVDARIENERGCRVCECDDCRKKYWLTPIDEIEAPK